MNIRAVYLFLIVVLTLGLFFEWSSEKKEIAVKSHLLEAQLPGYESKDGFVVIENKKLYVVVETKTGYIVETRIKEHLVENVDGSLGYRVFGASEDSGFNYYFKSGFEKNPDPSYKVVDFGPGFVDLRDESQGLFKRISFLERDYEISILDTSSNIGDGRAFASLRRTEGDRKSTRLNSSHQ